MAGKYSVPNTPLPAVVRTPDQRTVTLKELYEAAQKPSFFIDDPGLHPGLRLGQYDQDPRMYEHTMGDPERKTLANLRRRFGETPLYDAVNGYADADPMPQIVDDRWSYTANPYSPEYIQHMKDTGLFVPNPAHTITLSDGTPYLVPESKNDMFGSFSPYAPVPSYLGDMNLLVAAMNHVNSGGTDEYYTDVINRYKSNPNLLMSGVNQVDTMLDQAYSRIQQNPNDQWARSIITMYEPQRSAYKPMMQQFNAAFQQWQPNPGYGTSWQQTETPWQGMAQWLEQAQYGKQATGGGNYAPGFGNPYQNRPVQQNPGWTPYTNYPGPWKPNPQYQTQPYPGGPQTGYGQPYTGAPATGSGKPKYLAGSQPLVTPGQAQQYAAPNLNQNQMRLSNLGPSYRSWARR